MVFDRETSTKKTYASNIVNLHDKIYPDSNFENSVFLRNPKVIAKALKYKPMTKSNIEPQEYSYLSRRNYYVAIIEFLRALDPEGSKAITNYYTVTFIDSASEQYLKEQESGKISKKQAPNFVKPEIVQEFIAKAKENDKQLYILLRLISTYHCRNEIVTLKIIDYEKYKEGFTEEEKKHNYLVWGKNKNFRLVRFNFKTSTSYKKLDNYIDDKELKSELLSYLMENNKKDGDFVFVRNGKPMTTNALSSLLIYESKKLVGHSLSTTMIAKSLLSAKYADKNEDQKQDAKNRGHSVSVQNNVYVKQS
jgi:hypothetical protein